MRPEQPTIRLEADAPDGNGTVDACTYLFRACRALQAVRDDLGLELLFDVEPVRLPAATCDIIVLMVRAVIDDLIPPSRSAPSGSPVSLTLRRLGDTCAVMIEDRGFRTYRGGYISAPPSVEMLASHANGRWRVSATADHRAIGIVFGGARRTLHSRAQLGRNLHNARSLGGYHATPSRSKGTL
jgi:hypothetical protein